MRPTLLILAGLIACMTSSTARADQYKWCANYGLTEGSLNCYFVSREQCEATLAGIGGFCMPSPFANERPVTPPAQTQRKKKS